MPVLIACQEGSNIPTAKQAAPTIENELAQYFKAFPLSWVVKVKVRCSVMLVNPTNRLLSGLSK